MTIARRLDEAVARADDAMYEAMYEAKQQGKNRAVAVQPPARGTAGLLLVAANGSSMMFTTAIVLANSIDVSQDEREIGGDGAPEWRPRAPR